MKINIYILTYKGFNRLNKTLKSLFDSDLVTQTQHEYQIHIINNHTEIKIDDNFIDKVNLLNNNLRPDFSTGHMTRNWNQAIILGFKNLINPTSDIVITLQDDVILHPNWFSRLLSLHTERNFSFIQNGHGDALCSYTAEAVRKVGLWDERFLMGKQCVDYFYRQLMYNYDNCSINDPIHKRTHNLIFPNDAYKSFSYLVIDNFMGDHWPDPTLDLQIATKIINLKYNSEDTIYPWTEEIKNNAKNKIMNKVNFIFYSYFEKDIYDLDKKGYIL